MCLEHFDICMVTSSIEFSMCLFILLLLSGNCTELILGMIGNWISNLYIYPVDLSVACVSMAGVSLRSNSQPARKAGNFQKWVVQIIRIQNNIAEYLNNMTHWTNNLMLQCSCVIMVKVIAKKCFYQLLIPLYWWKQWTCMLFKPFYTTEIWKINIKSKYWI